MPAAAGTGAASSDVLREMPKVELHAHLGGSIRPATINELMEAKGLQGLSCRYGEGDMSADTVAGLGTAKTRMQHCFEMFDAIYKVTDNLEAISRITREVILDYSAENTKYLELRTSLKNLGGTGEEAYLDTVLSSIAEANASLPEEDRVHTEVLVSVNRGGSLEACKTAVSTAVKYKGRGVIGVDLSGNCYKGSFDDLSPYLAEAQRNGLPLTLHAGEKDDEAELRKIIDMRPGRLGHLVFSGEANEALVRERGIPIEMCITSNLITTNWRPEEHHVKEWVSEHPISINTDDRGVFGITLTSEFELLKEICEFTDAETFKVARGALKQSFLDAESQKPIAAVFDAFAKKHALAAE